jgi:hypothetical protein
MQALALAFSPRFVVLGVERALLPHRSWRMLRFRSASPASPRDERGGERFTPTECVAGASSARVGSSA